VIGELFIYEDRINIPLGLASFPDGHCLDVKRFAYFRILRVPVTTFCMEEPLPLNYSGITISASEGLVKGPWHGG